MITRVSWLLGSISSLVGFFITLVVQFLDSYKCMFLPVVVYCNTTALTRLH